MAEFTRTWTKSAQFRSRPDFGGSLCELSQKHRPTLLDVGPRFGRFRPTYGERLPNFGRARPNFGRNQSVFGRSHLQFDKQVAPANTWPNSARKRRIPAESRLPQPMSSKLGRLWGNGSTTSELAGITGVTFRDTWRATVRQISGNSILAAAIGTTSSPEIG